MDIIVFGERIKDARERLGLSQTELGRLISKDQRAISEYERGDRRMSVTDLPVLAEALRVPLLYFFEGEVTPEDREQRIIQEFRKLPNEQAQEDAIELLDFFIQALQKQQLK